MDRITDSFARISPSKLSKPSASMSRGIGHGLVPLDDDVSLALPNFPYALVYTACSALLTLVLLPISHSTLVRPSCYIHEPQGLGVCGVLWSYVIMLFFLWLPTWNGSSIWPASSPLNHSIVMGAVDMGSFFSSVAKFPIITLTKRVFR
jgi:hypothetical protein